MEIVNCVENNQPNRKHIKFLEFLNEMIKPDLVGVIFRCYRPIRFVQAAVLSVLWMYFTCCWITYEYH